MFDALLASPGRLAFWHAVFMAATVLIVIRGVAEGIEKAVKLLMPALFTLLVLLVAFVSLTFGPLVRRFDGRRVEPAGGARLFAWLAATLAVAAVGTLGAAVGLTAKTSPMLPLLGFVPWAQWGAWSGLAAGRYHRIAGHRFESPSRTSWPVQPLLRRSSSHSCQPAAVAMP